MEIGSVVRQFREARDMSQSQLAKALGYSGRSSIAQIERGAIEPSRDKRKRKRKRKSMTRKMIGVLRSVFV